MQIGTFKQSFKDIRYFVFGWLVCVDFILAVNELEPIMLDSTVSQLYPLLLIQILYEFFLDLRGNKVLVQIQALYLSLFFRRWEFVNIGLSMKQFREFELGIKEIHDFLSIGELNVIVEQ